jgi:hypothetical protein
MGPRQIQVDDRQEITEEALNNISQLIVENMSPTPFDDLMNQYTEPLLKNSVNVFPFQEVPLKFTDLPKIFEGQ